MFGKKDDILKQARSYPYWKQSLISIACVILHNFMYMTNHNPDCLHMYFNHEEDDDNEDDDNKEDNNPPESVPRDHLEMANVRRQMDDEMYTACIRQPWYRR